MDLQLIKTLCADEKLRWTNHIFLRLVQRDISMEDVQNAILSGEIIEDYPTDYPPPSCLIYGYTLSGKVLHVVAGMDHTSVYIITAYFPSSEKFQEDLKTRRER